ncbi:hypothetical protein JCM10212_000681 [Sporobolomyces blumeae]
MPAPTDSQPLIVARAVATVGLGVATGIMASLAIWSRIYDKGKATAQLTFPPATLLFAYAAYAAEAPPAFLPATFIARNRKLILALCSSLSASVIGYTVAFLMPTIKTLKGEEVRLATGSKSTVSTDDLIFNTWAKGHLVRFSFAATGFVLAVAELAFV